jgi:hypothetical protein
MGKRHRRMKAQDVFNASEPFLGKTASFEKAFPSVAELDVTVTEAGDDLHGGSRTSRYRNSEVPEYVNCLNPRCYNGGFHVGSAVHLMTYPRETEWSGERSCQGYEGSPKGRVNHGPCDHYFKVRIKVEYRDR